MRKLFSTLTATIPATEGCAFLGADMANPDPSPETRFVPGQSGNPGGKTAEHVRLERESAEMAAKLRHAMLSSMQERLSKITEGEEAPPDALDLLSADALRLFKDSEDRAHGTPKQSVEHGGEGGGPLIIQWRE